MDQVAEFLHRTVEISKLVQQEKGKKLKDFVEGLEGHSEVTALRKEVSDFASTFPIPGFGSKYFS